MLLFSCASLAAYLAINLCSSSNVIVLLSRVSDRVLGGSGGPAGASLNSEKPVWQGIGDGGLKWKIRKIYIFLAIF